jgi:recombination associated protein RdgC
MFKNLIAFRIGADWTAPSLAQLESLMQHGRFAPCLPSEEESVGWTAPRGQDHAPMLEVVGGQWIAQLMAERKSVPASAVAAEVERRCKEIEGQIGRAPGRRERKEMKEVVRVEMLPRAFAKRSSVLIWFDLQNRLLLVSSASYSVADIVLHQVLELMAAAEAPIPLSSLRTEMSPAKAMSEWLVSFEAPVGFTVDRDLELKQPDNEKSVVRYARHALDIEEVAEHIRAGKAPTQLAMTWDSRVSFHLTDSLSLKKIELLDAIFEGKEDEKGFDADVAIITGELSRLLPDLIESLGGEAEEPEVASAESGEAE